MLERISKIIGFNYILDLVQDKKVRRAVTAGDSETKTFIDFFLLLFVLAARSTERRMRLQAIGTVSNQFSHQTEFYFIRAFSNQGMVGVLMKHVSS